ncbi:MAG: T9SS type A sorting domain-containing protein, partial [Bacteroidota bacterium]
FWGSRWEVKAIEITTKGIYIGGYSSYVGGFPSNFIGYWSFDLADVSVEDEQPRGEVSTLTSPFPNPANTHVSSTLTLPKSQMVNIAIYNILGQQMEVLVDGMYPAGTHTIKWDASQAPAGLYFLRITTPDQTAVQKVVVAR